MIGLGALVVGYLGYRGDERFEPNSFVAFFAGVAVLVGFTCCELGEVAGRFGTTGERLDVASNAV